ncbi:putative TIM8-translocase of the mitochondrial inner membrane [Tilletiopsis washingtonensis]|uniref:Mitochondrial import inner membrane translocase subunit n=1 Tax=Tilletiopsis washingtonensis TaxID=58919 RepID=A0A316ZFD8_9BASI|nr:putative TIM8-translocase of the mitochondrial inner membrane [Tilletiopsis washingtonensis]PWN99754.1 putative TIM8-translocase of the mitochondrial inner membrane [Tilletiopsis washingtonensis]
MSAQSKSGLNEADQKELHSFLETKQAEARIQSTIHDHTDRCWDKCVKSAPGTSFARGEEACLANCVDRFLDTSIFIVNKVYGKAQAGA